MIRTVLVLLAVLLNCTAGQYTSCQMQNGNCGSLAYCLQTGAVSNDCVCKIGYTNSSAFNGTRFSCVPFDPCSTASCGSNSFCQSIGGTTAVCRCSSNYYYNTDSGICEPVDNCQTDNPGGCGFNSICTVTGPGTNNCTCNDGYVSLSGDGTSCIPVDPCLIQNGGCGSYSTCIFVAPNLSNCTCLSGYAGTNGQNCLPINSNCSLNNGGCDVTTTVCINTGAGTSTCSCKPGYSGFNGTACTAINNCVVSNGGCGSNSKCAITGPGVNKCTCNANYYSLANNGANCIAINSCMTSNGGCSPFALCTVSGANANTCACNSGYSGSGTTCVIINNCVTNNGGCGVNSTCSFTGPGTNICTCNVGYSSSNGANCVAINNCLVANGGCGLYSQCAMTAPALNNCTCNTNYHSPMNNGANCVAINSCATNNGGCSPFALCTVTIANMNICTCNIGYLGNGTTCVIIGTCANSGNCGANSTCLSIGPGPTSNCRCNVGYSSSTGANCVAINNCVTNNGGCGSNSQCAMTAPALNNCTCNVNYYSPTNNGTSCLEIDRCTSNNGGCGLSSTCNSTGVGTSSCSCNMGYYSSTGVNCNAINNCATNNGGCGINSTCSFTGPGTNICSCNVGYSSSNGANCGAINNCLVNNGGCGSNSACLYQGPGKNGCQCFVGFNSTNGLDTDCTSINSCTISNGGCGSNSVCTSTGPGINSCACNSGYWSSAAGANCNSFSVCPPGYYISVSGTSSSDRICALCTAGSQCYDGASFPCALGTYSSSGASFCSVADPGFYVTPISALGTRETICPSGSACVNGVQFSCGPSGFQPLAGQTECLNCSVCQTGDSVIQACSTTSDTICTDVTPPTLILKATPVAYLEAAYEKWIEPGYSAVDANGFNITYLVNIAGSVDTFVPDNYTLTYSVKDAAGNQAQAQRVVIVRDTIPPTMKVNFDPSLTYQLEFGSSYIDPGATAYSRVDGDLTPNVTVTVPPQLLPINHHSSYLKNFNVTYSVTDSSNNVAIITRLVKVVDTTVPSITIPGPYKINIEAQRFGPAFIPPQATAYDLRLGNLTQHIVVSNPVKINVTGTYNVTYTVPPSNGAGIAIAILIVQVVDTSPPAFFLNGPSPYLLPFGMSYIEFGAIALDGYDGNITNHVLITYPVNVSLSNFSSIPGEMFSIKYFVADSSNNTVVLQRNVTIVAATSQVSTSTEALSSVSSAAITGTICFVLGIIATILIVKYATRLLRPLRSSTPRSYQQTSFDWLHANISQNDADMALKANLSTNGVFLVSADRPSTWTLFVTSSNKVLSFPIVLKRNSFVVNHQQCQAGLNSLESIIDYLRSYSEFGIPLLTNSVSLERREGGHVAEPNHQTELIFNLRSETGSLQIWDESKYEISGSQTSKAAWQDLVEESGTRSTLAVSESIVESSSADPPRAYDDIVDIRARPTTYDDVIVVQQPIDC